MTQEQQHPITPPPELVASLRNSAPHGIREPYVTRELWLINSAYTAGANQELEACLANIHTMYGKGGVNWLCAMRRPKPAWLKAQALKGLKEVGDFTLGQLEGCSDFNEFKTHVDNIHRALGALPND
jgi:hypothetical protein